jgi:catechol 2,3-dioxygenase-like lactoylglutathione lyase family enzyme
MESRKSGCARKAAKTRASGIVRAATQGALALACAAAPLLAEADGPALTPVRRTTIVTADLDASLRFYRDLLGFTVEYDVEATQPAQLAAFAPGAVKGRAIALRRGARLGGSIGLFHVAGIAPAGACPLSAPAGSVGILLLTDDLGAMYRRLKDARVPFINEPHTYAYDRGPTETFTVFDPNCVRVAFARVRSETLEQSEGR